MGGDNMVQPAVNYTPLTPLSFLVRSAYVFPEKTAVVYKDTRYTYRQFCQRVNRCATALQAAGVTSGDRVAFLCPNIPPMLEAHTVCLWPGGYWCPSIPDCHRRRLPISCTIPAPR